MLFRSAIKWPNDLLCGGRKLCGILTEASLCAENAEVNYAVVGTGINVNLHRSAMPEEIAEKATSVLIETGKTHSRAEVAAAYAAHFAELLAVPFSVLMEEYRAALIVGTRVRVLQGGIPEDGEAYFRGVDEEGRALIDYADGTRVLSSGEIEQVTVNG